MSADKLRATTIGTVIELERDQWNGKKAKISDYSGLLDEVKQYTWTYHIGEHPYLRSKKLNMSLHKFVLCFVYGKERVETMLSYDNIIEHLDNDGLNCTFENLHIISSDLNKVKAFSIDKMRHEYAGLPRFVTGVYFSHLQRRYQLQVFLNDNLFWGIRGTDRPVPVEELFFLYVDFENLYLDWFYLLNSRENGSFDISKMHTNSILAKLRPVIELTNEERDHIVVERDGKYYINLNMNPEKLVALCTTSYKPIAMSE